MDRKDIIDGNRLRQERRTQFMSDASTTGQYLHPKNVTGRWKERQKAKLSGASDNVTAFAKNNRLLITAIGAGGLLLAGYRPITKLAKRFKAKRVNQDMQE